jgi:hypothetical protein
LAAISISNTRVLDFGSFVASAGGSVTVGTSGARSAVGHVMLVPSGGGTAAQFKVSGTPGATYSISLPADGTVALVNGSGQSMGLRDFTSDPSGYGQLSLLGEQLLSVGATLDVGSNQPRGTYSGSFTVTVEYQ